MAPVKTASAILHLHRGQNGWAGTKDELEQTGLGKRWTGQKRWTHPRCDTVIDLWRALSDDDTDLEPWRMLAHVDAYLDVCSSFALWQWHRSGWLRNGNSGKNVLEAQAEGSTRYSQIMCYLWVPSIFARAFPEVLRLLCSCVSFQMYHGMSKSTVE